MLILRIWMTNDCRLGVVSLSKSASYDLEAWVEVYIQEVMG